MSNFLKEFTVRRGDLDANRHVGNVTYSAFMNDTRMDFLAQHGFAQERFHDLQMGLVIISEEYYYLKEILPGQTVYIDLELLGHSEDYRFVRFGHSLFNEEGLQCAYSEVLFTWMNLQERKIIQPIGSLRQVISDMPKSERFGLIEKSETRSLKVPYHKRMKKLS